MAKYAKTFKVGDVVTAGGAFAGTVVRATRDRIVVENECGRQEQFGHSTLERVE